jgi:methylmalonyl-CoA mutase N-terminal domain/subunit
VLDGIAIQLTAQEDLVLNLSMVRALRLLWMQALSAAGLDEYSYEIFISAKVPRIMPLSNDQMISAGFIATSLVLGGIDALYVAPPDHKKPDHRWGLMAQHILRDEAMLNKVNDPFSGSHVIERLTEVIAKKIWESKT